MLGRSSLRLVLKLLNNYYNFLATKRVPGNKTGPIDYLGHPIPLHRGRILLEDLNISNNNQEINGNWMFG